jgi:hypothetical protein
MMNDLFSRFRRLLYFTCCFALFSPAANARSSAEPENILLAETKEPSLYTQPWIWAIIVVLLILLVAAVGSSAEEAEEQLADDLHE